MGLFRRMAPPPNHAAVREQYEAHRDGALSVAETAAYQHHLRICVSCRQWVAQQDALITGLRADMPPPHRLAVDGAVKIQLAMYKQIKRSIFMQNVKLSLRMIAAVVAVILIAGVALWWQFGLDNQLASPPETADSAATIPASAGEPVNLTFAVPPAQYSQYELVAALFNGLNPDITVQVIILLPDTDPATQADTAVLNLPPATAASFVNLTERLQTATDINPQDYYTGALEGCQMGSYTYGLPLSLTPSYLYFDQVVLAEAGVVMPAAEWTWSDLMRTITALSSGDGTRYGFGNVDGLLRLLRPLLAANLDENGILNPTALEPYLQDIANLVAAGHVADVDVAELEALILDGRIGLWLDNPVTLSPRLVEISQTLGRLPIPPLAELTATNPTEVACLTISRGSSQQEAAWRWLQYLTYNPPTLAAGSVPANRLVIAAAEENSLAANNQTVQDIGRAWFSSQRSQTENVLPALRQHIVAGVPLAEALAQALPGVEAAAGTEAEATVPVIASPPPNSGPTTINFFGDQFQLADAAHAFGETHPEIIIAISFTLPSGSFTMADIAERYDCFSWQTIGLAPQSLSGIVWDISELAAPETLADYRPELLASMQVDGALLGLPLEVNPVVVRYNESRFNESGVPVPTADWTLSDLVSTATQFGEPGDPPFYGLASSAFGVLDGPEAVEWLLLEHGVQPWDVATGTVNLTDPAVTAVFTQYVSWLQQNTLYATLPGEAPDERGELVQNRRAALWIATSDNRPISLGVPEPFAMLPLPQLGSQVLPSPRQEALFISNLAENPNACMQWFEFLTTRADVITAVPARQSVANSRSWENEVGPENAAVYREALARHLAASQPDAGLVSFGEKFPLYYWLQEAATAAAAGGDLNALLANAQTHSEQYLACLTAITDPTFEEAEVCAEQADPDYSFSNNQ